MGNDIYLIPEYGLVRVPPEFWSNRFGFVGVYSNNYLDDSDRPDIISNDAHNEYVRKIDDQEAPHPQLEFWHTEFPMGQSVILFNMDGFVVVLGFFLRKWDIVAESLLMRSDIDWGMSHGCSESTIERDPDENRVITRYVSDELTFLPRHRAANKFTFFDVIELTNLKGDISEMTLDDKLNEAEELFGNTVIDSIKDAVAGLMKSVTASKRQSKDADQDVADAESKLELGASTDQGISNEIKESETSESKEGKKLEAESSGEVEGKNEKSVEEVGKPAGENDTGGTGEVQGDIQSGTFGVPVKVLDEIMASISSVAEATAAAVASLEGRINVLDERVVKAETQAAVNIAAVLTKSREESRNTTLASIMGSVAELSAVGNQASHVHGNSTLAKSSPDETTSTIEKSDGLTPMQKALFGNF